MFILKGTEFILHIIISIDVYSYNYMSLITI
jgi:hypothetical protein